MELLKKAQEMLVDIQPQSVFPDRLSGATAAFAGDLDRAEAALTFLVGQPLADVRLTRPDLPPAPAGDPDAIGEEALEYPPDVLAARARAARARASSS